MTHRHRAIRMEILFSSVHGTRGPTRAGEEARLRSTTGVRNGPFRRNSYDTWGRHSTAVHNKDTHTHKPGPGTCMQAEGSRRQPAVHSTHTLGRR
jgi:hypothetical protein